MPGTVVAQLQDDDGSQEAAEEEVDTHLAGLEQGRD